MEVLLQNPFQPSEITEAAEKKLPPLPPETTEVSQTASLWGNDAQFEQEMKRRGLSDNYKVLLAGAFDEDRMKNRVRSSLFLSDSGASDASIRSGMARSHFANEWGIDADDPAQFAERAGREAQQRDQRAKSFREAAMVGAKSQLQVDQDDDGLQAFHEFQKTITDDEALQQAARGFLVGRHAQRDSAKYAKLANQLYDAVTSGESFDPADIDESALRQLGAMKPEEQTKFMEVFGYVHQARGGAPDAGWIKEAGKRMGRIAGGFARSMGQVYEGAYAMRQVDRILASDALYVHKDDEDIFNPKRIAGGAIASAPYDYEGEAAQRAEMGLGPPRERFRTRRLNERETKDVKAIAQTMKGAIVASRMSGELREQVKPLLDDTKTQQALDIFLTSLGYIPLYATPHTLGGIVAPDYIARRQSELEMSHPEIPEDKRNALAFQSGMLETGISRMQFMTWFKGVPGVNALTRRMAGKRYGKGIDLLTRTATTLPVEMMQEFAEEQSLNMVMEIASMMDEEIPGGEFRQTTEQFAEMLGPMAAGMLPLVVMGGMVEMKVRNKMTPEMAMQLEPFLAVDLMRMVGYTAEEAAEINAIADPVEKAQRAVDVQQAKGAEGMKRDRATDPETVESAKRTLETLGQDPDTKGMPRPIVQLYRGESETTKGGRFFTSDPEYAAGSGEVRSVSVPFSQVLDLTGSDKQAIARLREVLGEGSVLERTIVGDEDTGGTDALSDPAPWAEAEDAGELKALRDAGFATVNWDGFETDEFYMLPAQEGEAGPVDAEPLTMGDAGVEARDGYSPTNDPEMTLGKDEETAPPPDAEEGRGPGAATVMEMRGDAEWRVRNAARRFNRVANVSEVTGVDGWDEGSLEASATSTYVPITGEETIEEMRELIRQNGVVNSATALLNGKVIVDGKEESVEQRLGFAQRVALGQILLDELSTSAAIAREYGQTKSGTQLEQLTFDIAQHLTTLGTELGQGVQAFRIWSYLHPEIVVSKMDEKLKQDAQKKGKLRKPTDEQKEQAKGEVAKVDEEIAETEATEEQEEKKVAKWIEEIDKDVAGRESTQRRQELQENAPEGKFQETMQGIVNAYTRGSAMTEEYLERKFLEHGFSEEEAAEGVLRSNNLRKARQNLREQKARRRFWKALEKGRAKDIAKAHKEYVANWNRAEQFVQSLWEERPIGTRPTEDNLTPRKVVEEFKKSAMTKEGLAEALRQFTGAQDQPLFTDAQIDEAVERAVQERNEGRMEAEMKAMRQAAKSYVQGLVDMLGREGFAKAFGRQERTDDKSKITVPAETYKEVRERIDTAIDEAGQYNDLFGILMASPGLTTAQKSKLLNLARETREAPDGFLRAAKAREMVSYMYQVEGLKAMDVATSYWYANILSGLNTQGINLFGSGIHLMLRVMAAIPVNHPRDVGNMMLGMIKAVPLAWTEAVGAIIDGRQVTKTELKYNLKPDILEAAKRDAPKGAWQKLAWVVSHWKYVFRTLQAGDGFFYRTAYEGRAHLAASRVTRREMESSESFARALADNLHDSSSEQEEAMAIATQEVERMMSGESEAAKKRDIRRRAFEILDQRRDSAIRSEAHKFGLLATYTNVPQGALGEVSRMMNKLNEAAVIETPFGDVPITRWFVPFVNIVANVANASLDFTVWGAVRGGVGHHLVGRGNDKFTMQERLERATASVIGAAITGVIVRIAAHYLDDDDPPFAIYASGPRDRAKFKQWYERGNRPFTLKIGDLRLFYFETPLVMPLAFFGALHDQHRYNPKAEERGLTDDVERFNMLLAMAAKAYAKPGFINSIADLAQLVTGKGPITKGGLDPFVRVSKGFIPAQGLMRDVLARPFDTTVIDNNGLKATLLRDVPFAQQHFGTRPMLSGFGEDIERDIMQRIPIASRFASLSTSDPEWLWLGDNDLWLTGVPSSTKVAVANMTGPEKARMKRTLEQRERDMGRIGFDVLTDDEAYEVQKIAGPKIREMIRALRIQLPNVPTEEKETVQQQIKENMRQIRRDARLDLLERLYPDIW